MWSQKRKLREVSFEVVMLHTKCHTKPLVPGVPIEIEWGYLCSESLLSWDGKETRQKGFVQCKQEEKSSICLNKDEKIIVYQSTQLRYKL